MSDLISRKAVIDIIHKEIESTTSYMEHKTQINIEFAVNELPVAYNAEKVVAELEELPIHDSEGHWGEYLDKENVIEIVRKGGWNE